jgi:signal transduction histidine kinase/CheY-like chemotaxis protein
VNRIERLFEDYLQQARAVVARVEEVRDVQGRFMAVGTSVQHQVSEGIHSLARTDLIEAQQSAVRAIHVSLVAVLMLLVIGIVIGAATAIPAGRSIVRAEARILEQHEQLRERMEELAEAHQRKDEFLGVLGHELRNPLAPLSNALHVLERQDGALPADVRDAHRMMKRQVRSMTRLVDDLLDVSRINQGKITLRREPVDLSLVCSQVVEDLGPLAIERRHRLEVSLPERGPGVNADPTRLAQIVANLLFNAVKYTPEGGWIRLEVESRDGQAEIRVSDNGIGLSTETRARMFEPFVQGDDALTRRHGGLGIGLSLVQRLVELHGGTIEAESGGQGEGSTFTVRLPALDTVPPRPPASAPAGPAAPPGTNASQRVLVVDDNRDAAQTLGALLEVWGHQARIVNNGEAALTAAAAEPPDVVLLDIGLPGMDGYEVGERLRQQRGTGGALLIALTGFGQESDRRRALAAGFDEHMTKPVDPEALKRLLARPRD